jgi:hypothetical protein
MGVEMLLLHMKHSRTNLSMRGCTRPETRQFETVYSLLQCIRGERRAFFPLSTQKIGFYCPVHTMTYHAVQEMKSTMWFLSLRRSQQRKTSLQAPTKRCIKKQGQTNQERTIWLAGNRRSKRHPLAECQEPARPRRDALAWAPQKPSPTLRSKEQVNSLRESRRVRAADLASTEASRLWSA